jgi:hypothetical protein
MQGFVMLAPEILMGRHGGEKTSARFQGTCNLSHERAVVLYVFKQVEGKDEVNRGVCNGEVAHITSDEVLKPPLTAESEGFWGKIQSE